MQIEKLESALRNAHAAGDVSAAKQIANAIKQHKTPKPIDKPSNAIAGGVDTTLQGATFGLGDEIQALIGAAVASPFVKDKTFSELYEEGKGIERGSVKQFAKDNPKTAFALELGGGLTSGGVGALKTGAAKTLPKVAAYGAGTGALGGFGYSEADDLEGQGLDTLKGGVTGAVLAPVVKVGADKVITPLLNKGKGVVTDVANQLKKELERGKLTPQQAADKLKSNPSLVLGDLTENLQFRTASVAGLPGKAQDTAKKLLTQRNRTQSERLLPHIRKGLGNKQGYMDAVDTLTASMKQKAGPLYDEAYKTQLQPTETISKVLKKAKDVGAITGAKKLAKLDGVDFDKPFKKAAAQTSSSSKGQRINYATLTGKVSASKAKASPSSLLPDAEKEVPIMGSFSSNKAPVPSSVGRINYTTLTNEVPEQMPMIQKLDYVKRALGDVEGKFIRAGKDQMARAVGNTRRELTEELKKQSPAYEKALRVWSDGMDDQNAIDIGLKALKEDSGSLVNAVKKMSESELNHFRIGVMKALEGKIEGQSVNRDLVKQLQDIPRINKALSIAFKDEDSYQGFLNALQDESKMFDTFTKALTNSNTARLAGSNKELGQGALNAILTKGMSLPLDIGRAALNKINTSPEIRNEAFRDMLGDQLLKNDPVGLLQILSQPQRQVPQSLVGALGAQGGLLTAGQ